MVSPAASDYWQRFGLTVLRKIPQLIGLGPFFNGTPKPAVFDRVSLVYGENARGKSTLAMALHACALGDASRIATRQTMDAAIAPELTLIFDPPIPAPQIRFSGGAWSGKNENFLVFDTDFVDRNVHSSSEVRPDQRQALLEFVLGDQTLLLKNKVDELTRQIDAGTRKRGEAERLIRKYSLALPLTAFIKLPVVPDAPATIAATNKRLAAARNAAALIQRQAPIPLPILSLQGDELFHVLHTNLDDVEAKAEAIVHAHFEKHDARLLEDWISSGQQFLEADSCPFCDQPMEGLELIRAYRTYFSKAYAELKREIAELEETFAASSADLIVTTLSAPAARNTALIEAWKDQLDVVAPVLPLDEVSAAMHKAYERSRGLAVIKRQRPFDIVGTEEQRVELLRYADQVNGAITEYNTALRGVVSAIDAFKSRLSSENIQDLQRQITHLEAGLNRYRPDVVEAVAVYQAAFQQIAAKTQEKANTRAQIDKLMAEILGKYQGQINTVLGRFGADFRIEQMQPTYAGTGEPRVEYMLAVRRKLLKLGSRTDLGPSFATVLSEGDKRTFALAFFLAKLEDDPGIADRIIVIDDPISSLDANRRNQTVTVLSGLATRCNQLIVLSHDPHFLRRLRDKIAKDKRSGITPAALAIERAAQDYSQFGPCDLDGLCSSEYYKNHKMISDYVEGVYRGDLMAVAKAVRPLIEGFYHRRFPNQIPRVTLFGNVIKAIRDATPPNPLTNLQPILIDLDDLNEFLGQFHHDNDDEQPVPVINDGQLAPYARLALQLIYKGAR